MNEADALAKMVPPNAHRPVWLSGVNQVLIVRSCSKQCYGCTQNSGGRGSMNAMTLENFEKACICLAPRKSVFGVFGGQPTLHKQFPEICKILQKHIPKHRRGIWTNSLAGHGAIVRETFNPDVSNINVHQDKADAAEFRRDWPELKRILGEHEDSRHSFPLVAIQDMEDMNDSERWEMISECMVNKLWSDIIVQFRGELRYFACELAGAQAVMHQSEPDYPDTGLPVTDRIWDHPMEFYADQVRYHCMACGMALRTEGELANNPNGREMISKTHVEAFKPKDGNRLVQLVTNSKDANAKYLEVTTNYIQNSHIKPKAN